MTAEIANFIREQREQDKRDEIKLAAVIIGLCIQCFILGWLCARL